ncbi:MAG: VWA domain-containing protein [Nitrosopumilaceae archaeon]|nr:VWA domain-containing protein [Nitrosopumilaceae archaeon]
MTNENIDPKIKKLITDSNDLDQISKQIIDYLDKHRPLSKLIDDLENDIPIDKDDDQYLETLPKPKRKGKITNEFLEGLSEDQKKDFLVKSEQKNLKLLAKVKEKLKASVKQNFDKQINRYRTKQKQLLQEVNEYWIKNDENIERDLRVDTELLNGLKGLFNEIRSQKINTFARKGKKPIINRVIQTKLSGNMRDCFITKKPTNDLTFNFVVDQSGSMSGSTRKIAELIKTFFKAIEDLKQIKINVIGFESDTLNIIENDETKLGKISYSGGSTPSCEALTFASDLIKKQSGKSVLIFVSDGSPDGIGQYFSTDKYISYLLDDLKKEKQIESFGILIGSYSNFYSFSKIFGSNFAQFSNISGANKQLLDIFRTFIEQYLRVA